MLRSHQLHQRHQTSQGLQRKVVFKKKKGIINKIPEKVTETIASYLNVKVSMYMTQRSNKCWPIFFFLVNLYENQESEKHKLHSYVCFS